MDVVAACKYINDIDYMPGWNLRARVSDHNIVWLGVDVITNDSSRDLAPLGYPRKIHAGDEFLIDTRDVYTTDQLDDIVIAHLMQVHLHEAREFFRHRQLGSEAYEAPFHPHRPEGQARWERRYAY